MYVERKRTAMGSGYHGCFRKRHSMFTRAPIALVIALLPALAGASDRWQANVAAPRRGLPPVTVVMGEPGPYIPTSGARIELSVAESPSSFDGYIGYHFTLDGRGARLSRTSDLPVISRISIPRGGHWKFATQARIDRVFDPKALRYAIVIEWRNSAGRILAQQSAGTPPWSTPRPLRITRAGEEQAPDALLLGEPPFALQGSRLPLDAQWYQGVSSVVVPVDVWLDLPAAAREAIFASGRPVVFFGVPRNGQTMTPLDDALIPVAFEPTPSRTIVPWPYRTNASEIASSWTWRAKPDARIAGNEASPYLASSLVATYVADVAALASPVPSMKNAPAWLIPPHWLAFRSGGRPSARELIREFRPFIVCIAMAVLSIVIWLSIRRTPRFLMLLVAVVISAAMVGARDWLRPSSGTLEWEQLTPLSPTVQRHVHVFHDYALTPLPERRLPPELARTTLSGHGEAIQNAEIRVSDTAPGHGALVKLGSQSDAMTRWSARNELGVAPRVSVQGRASKTLEIDFESTTAVDFIAAHWECGRESCGGTIRLNGAKSGHATIRNGSAVWPILGVLPSMDGDVAVQQLPEANTHVFLIEKRRNGMRFVEWIQRTGDSQSLIRIEAHLHRVQGKYTASVVLPRKPTMASHRFSVLLRSAAMPPRGITVTGESGSVVLDTGGRLQLLGLHQYGAPPDALARIAPNGGILQITIEPAEATHDDAVRSLRSIWFVVLENEQ